MPNSGGRRLHAFRREWEHPTFNVWVLPTIQPMLPDLVSTLGQGQAQSSRHFGWLYTTSRTRFLPSGRIPFGQLHHGIIYQQARRDSFSDPTSPGPRHVGVVWQSHHSPGRSPPPRDMQRLSWDIVNREVLSNGVILAPSDDQSSIFNLGNANDGPVCHPEEQETISVLMPTGIRNQVGFMT